MSTHSSITKVEALDLDTINAMDAAEVAAYIKGARKAVKAGDNARMNATDRAAYAMWMAEFVQGVVGKANKPSKDDIDPGWMTDEAWAQSFDKVKSNAGYWRTLGRVLVDLKVDKDGEFYKRLRVSNAYQKPEVKTIINAETTTPENVEEKVSAWLDTKFDKFGKALPVKRAPGTPGGTKAATVADAVAKIKGTSSEKALVLIAAVATLSEEFDADGWFEVDTAYEALRTVMNEKFKAELSIAKTGA